MAAGAGVRVAVSSAALLGESPMWHSVEQVLYNVPTSLAGRRPLRKAGGFHVQSEAALKALRSPLMLDEIARTSARGAAPTGFEDELENQPVKALTRDEAQALRVRNPPLSPWRVIAVQVAIGAVVVLAAGLISSELMGSALYGAATAVVPGALMARGTTTRLSRVSPGASAVSVIGWSTVKTGVSIAMLVLAPKLVQPLSWPALLAALVLCMQVYWFALLWRGR